MKKYQKELILIIFLTIPYLYLAFIWNSLPTQIIIPNNDGTIDTQFAKTWLLLLGNIMGITMYLLMLLWPILDPKKRIQEMGGKYYMMRTVNAISLSALSIYYLYIIKEVSVPQMNVIFILAGITGIATGNYMQTLRQNYFFGYKNPWTLESEIVWKKTHRLGGRITMGNGVLLILVALMAPLKFMFLTMIFVMGGTLLFLYIYSYFIFQTEKKRAALDTVINEDNSVND